MLGLDASLVCAEAYRIADDDLRSRGYAVDDGGRFMDDLRERLLIFGRLRAMQVVDPARPTMSERQAAERAALASRREQTRLQLAKLRADMREQDCAPPRVPSRADLRRFGYATEQRPSGWALTLRPRDERGKQMPPVDVETWLRSEDEAWAVAESHYQD
jgi:hypothetical protein